MKGMEVCFLLLLTFAAAALLGMLWRMTQPQTWAWGQPLGEEAASAIEFTLVFPIFLALVLVIWQLLLLVQAAQVMSYAALVAVRSAIVDAPQPPQHQWNRNAVDTVRDKHERAYAAAVTACALISPPLAAWQQPGGTQPLTNPISSLGDTTRAAAMAAVAATAQFNGALQTEKAHYAAAFTTVEITGPRDGVRFAVDASLTVTVTHKFFLRVPYANHLFSDHVFGQGVAASQRTLTAQYTLRNEGYEETP
jgi:hypothetical protein